MWKTTSPLLRLLVLGIIAAWLLSACTQPVEVTRIVPQTVLAPATVLAEITAEVTREVQVEVTREVLITVPVTVVLEVTQLVEMPVTVTPSATPTQTPSPTPLPTSASVVAIVALATTLTVDQLILVRTRLRELAESIDWKVQLGPQNTVDYIDRNVYCADVLAAHDRVQAVLIPPVTSGDPTEEQAYAYYQAGVDTFLTGLVSAWVEGCPASLANGIINQLDEQSRRQLSANLDSGLNQINQAIALLGGE